MSHLLIWLRRTQSLWFRITPRKLSDGSCSIRGVPCSHLYVEHGIYGVGIWI